MPAPTSGHLPAFRTISASAVLVVQQANAVTGEVPYWDAQSGLLWWTDIQGHRLLSFDPATGAETIHNLPSMAGLVVGRHSGGLVLGLEDGLYAFDPEHGLGSCLLPIEPDQPLTRINDGNPDPLGRLWFGTMDKTGQFLPIGSVYRLDLDGSLYRVGDARIPNGIDFSPDGRRFYVAETHERRVDVHDHDISTGSIGPARVFFQTAEGEAPDGCCVDAEGALWIAIIGGSRIERRLPDGTLDTVIELPTARPTMPILGGRDGRTMFITSQRRLLGFEALKRDKLAGDLLAVRVDVPAKPVNLAKI
ncbi:MAG: SMP-30/gluconolactonase/LRE family protein [Methylobacterium sp.]|jgi:sugar lactone lactonase YvrE|nr:SMP-30/gluconolactonase/LRE family protein [Methylobacterium sp.]MCA3619197.1 SMP-30/gluconolactonase/LRE family protein [Methylobacterium sp.]MCA3622511.1 SMP-30/gluconolactonase/LRE family protein [Methylobacterium sp.]